MSIEIERKFLVLDDSYKEGATPVRIVQGYICSSEEKVVRVRIKGERAYLTLKDSTVGFSRHEFEYQIPAADARTMIDTMCDGEVIDKTRWVVDFGGYTWEVDEFHGDNQGLVVAEIELEHADAKFDLPDWIGREVTGEERYYNACLYRCPYTRWNL